MKVYLEGGMRDERWGNEEWREKQTKRGNKEWREITEWKDERVDGTEDEEFRCHDCNALLGNYHHSGCDCEICPKCHQQLISCDC